MRTPHATVLARLKKAGVKPKKSWGQNFLVDSTVLHEIVSSLGPCDAHPVVELGAGTGALTWELIQWGHRVVAVERDRDLVPVLEALEREASCDRSAPESAQPWLTVLEADAARLDYHALATRYGSKLRVVGNLPYQLSGRILVSLADAHPFVAQATVMVQREVADRLLASPDSKAYGLLTILVGRVFDVSHVVAVAPGSFHPPPKVHSTVIALRRRPGFEDRSPEGDKALVLAARAAFGSRRKMLRNSLLVHTKGSAEAIDRALAVAQLRPDCRAESLALEDFERLGVALREAMGGAL